MYAIINYNSSTTQTREPYEEDNWDRGETSSEHYIESFSVSEENRWDL